jgi:hypothetical protein
MQKVDNSSLENKIEKTKNRKVATIASLALTTTAAAIMTYAFFVPTKFIPAQRTIKIREQEFKVYRKELGYEISTIQNGDTLKAADVNGDGVVDHSITNTRDSSFSIEMYNIFDPHNEEIKINPVPQETQYAYDTVMYVYNNQGKLNIFN